EVVHGPTGPVSEDAVLATGIESEEVQACLEGANVVAAERWIPKIEDAIADGVAGLHELPPGVVVDGPVDDEVPPLLELSNSSLGGGAEQTVLAGIDREPEHGQTGLDVQDGLAAVATTKGVHRDHSDGRAAARRHHGS